MITALIFTLAVVTKQAPAAPIAIESCKFIKSASFSRGVQIVYKNTAKVAARMVVFSVSQRKDSTYVIDEGTFAPGRTIDHTMTSVPMTLWMGETPSSCAVVHVHFSDGTTWSP